MSDLGQLHDRFFRETFARPAVAADFLRHYLPAPVSAVLDTATLVLEPGSYVDRNLRQHFSDMLYRVTLRGGQPAFVYVLMEDKRQADPLVAFQLLRYMVRIWERALRAGDGLIPIIPVVLYQGQEPWRVGRDFADLYDGPEPLRHYWPAFGYHLADVSTSAGTQLLGALWLQGILEVMRHISSPDLAARLPTVMAWLRTAEGQPGLAEMWVALLTYVVRANEAVSETDVRTAIDAGFAQEGETMMTTLYDKWVEQGVRQGRQEGRQEGQRVGLLSGIEVALDLKFGADGLALMPQIAAIDDVEQLQVIQAALRTAATVSDVRRLIP